MGHCYGERFLCFAGSCWRRVSWGCSRRELPWQQPSTPSPPQLPAASFLPTFPHLPVLPFHLLKWFQLQKYINLWSSFLKQGLWSDVVMKWLCSLKLPQFPQSMTSVGWHHWSFVCGGLCFCSSFIIWQDDSAIPIFCAHYVLWVNGGSLQLILPLSVIFPSHWSSHTSHISALMQPYLPYISIDPAIPLGYQPKKLTSTFTAYWR